MKKEYYGRKLNIIGNFVLTVFMFLISGSILFIPGYFKLLNILSKAFVLIIFITSTIGLLSSHISLFVKVVTKKPILILTENEIIQSISAFYVKKLSYQQIYLIREDASRKKNLIFIEFDRKGSYPFLIDTVMKITNLLFHYRLMLNLSKVHCEYKEVATTLHSRCKEIK